MLRVISFACVFCFSLLVATVAQGEMTSKPISFANEISFPSKHLEAPQTIHIYLPDGYSTTSEVMSYPVIYTFDGWLLSQTVSGVVQHLGSTAAMPKAIVVAITTDNDYAYGPSLYTSKSGWGDDPTVKLDGFSGGGADLYLSFLKDELIPHIDNTYKTNDFRAIIGMSPSAAFALHSFWKEPELFNAHFLFAATDVLGMGYTPDTTFIDKITQSLAETPDQKRYLYIASAQREADANPIRLENIAALEKAVEPYTERNFKLRAEHIENYGHYPMVVPGLLSAIDLVFPNSKWGMSGRFQKFMASDGNALENILAYYAMLSKEVGFDAYPNADLRRNAASLRSTGNRLRRQGRIEEAVDVYNKWITYHPNSPKAHFGLALTMEADNKPEQAIKFAEKAVLLATEQKYMHLQGYKDYLEELKSATSD